MAATWQ